MQQQQKPKTRENLDMDLDQYMAKSKGHLDADLDTYMAQANSATNQTSIISRKNHYLKIIKKNRKKNIFYFKIYIYKNLS